MLTLSTKTTFLTCILSLAATAVAQKPESTETPGLSWHADFETARKASAEDQKPVALYFTFET